METIFFNDFVNKENIIYLESKISKKKLRALRREYLENSFFPVQVVPKGHKYIKKDYEKLFYKRYHEVVDKQFSSQRDKVLFDIIYEYIKLCPYCKNNDFIIVHNYTQEDTNCSLFLCCKSCKKIISEQSLIQIMDASYEYSDEMHCLINEYCSDYSNKKTLSDIRLKLRTLITEGYFGCM